MQLEVTVDRIEGDIAVLEVGEHTVDWPVSALPPGAAEGSRYVLTFAAPSSPSDAAARDARSEAEARLARLRAANPSTDDEIDL